MAAKLPPVPTEQAFLETYFQCLSKFAFDKAKELSEKEKDGLSKSTPIPQWGSVVQCLVNLALAEKAYMGLLFLGQNLGNKLFGRSNSLKNTLTTLMSDFQKIEASTNNRRGNSEEDDNFFEALIGHLCGQLCAFTSARLRMVDFYEHLVLLGQSKNISYQDIQPLIHDIIQKHQKSFHHPILSPLKSSFSLECDIINHLIQAQLDLQNASFLPSLLHLNDAHTKLNTWGCVDLKRDSKKLAFGSSSKHPPIPALYMWTVKFKGLLVSKFTLYFQEVLSKQASGSELKSNMMKCTIDFVGKIAQFQRKTDAVCVSLILDTNSLGVVYKGQGYHHPEKYTESPTGLESYPAIFSCPAEHAHKKHLLPGVVSLLTQRAHAMDTSDKVRYFYDEKVPCTYFFTTVETPITLVVIYETKKSEKDSYIHSFIVDLCVQLRGTKHFQNLKPGTK